jgi:hypothetical protein
MSARAKRKSSQISSDPKLRDLILYIAWRSEGDNAFGSTKLNKLLFYSDFLAYRLLGKAITGQEYQALEWGPAPRRLLSVIGAMLKRGEIQIRTKNFYGKPQRRPVPIDPPQIDTFTPEQVSLVDQIIRDNWGKTAREMSDMSHQFIGYRITKIGDTIPYGAALIVKPEVTPALIEHGRRMIPRVRRALARHAK